jgi:hypothetical protein
MCPRRVATLLATALAPVAMGMTCDHRTKVEPLGGRDVDPEVLALLDAHDGGLDGSGQADGSGEGSGEPALTAADCDLTGVWGIRQLAFNQDDIIGSIQASSEWHLVTFEDRGDEVVATRESFCGVQVSGSATVELVPEALPTALHANRWDGRRGTFAPVGARCELTLEPFYIALGVDPARYLPTETDPWPRMADLAASMPLPTAESPDGAQDWDGDGVPGVAFRVSGAVNGRRNAVQRFWYRYYSTADGGYEVAGNASAFVVRAEVETEEHLIAVEGCDPFCGLLSAGSSVAPGKAHRVYFERLGRDEAEAEATGVVVAGDELESCFRLQEHMPHDPRAR